MQAGYDIEDLFKEAQSRWLKPAEVLFILQNHEKYQLTQEPPQRPTSGSVFLFNKRVLRFFRKDGHNWRKKKDGRAVGEAHERLKVGNVEALNCYYAHGEQNPNFQRRSYWMLDPAYEHIVLVHYREITEGRPSPGYVAVSPGVSSTFILSPTSYTTQNPGSTSVISDLYEQQQSLSSPSSVEVTSEVASKDNGLDSKGEISGSETEVNQALRKLKEQLSLNDDMFEEIHSFSSQDLEYKTQIPKQDQCGVVLQSPEYIVQEGYKGGHAGFQGHSNNLLLEQDAGTAGNHLHQLYGHSDTDGSKEPLFWKDMLDSCDDSAGVESQQKPLSSSWRGPAEEQELSRWPNFSGSNIEHSPLLLPQEAKYFKIPEYSSGIGPEQTNSGYATFFDQDHIGVPHEADLRLTVAQKQKFAICEICPDWGYANEATKVIIVGSFLSEPSESGWSCMFGDTEVPLQIIQEGVIRCEAPPHLPGKVTLCITSGNRESCSEVKEFDYRLKTSSYTHDNLSPKAATKSHDELLLLVRFGQMLLADSSLLKGEEVESEYLLRRMKADDDLWGQVIDALLVGSGTSSDTIDWLLQELLKDKLQQWLSCKSMGESEQPGCSLSKKEQGIIHMVAGLGFEWALNPILSQGVNINFRDINGWTALHWAARFGREKMVATLLASGASAGAVTDPNAQDPTGKTPASIAASSGHKGLAGYLSEVALTSHLSSLTLEESELSKGSAEVEAEIAVNRVSKASLSTSEDQLSLKDTLAAVRNAAQAAARIQSAFRAHSFRMRQLREAAAADAIIDEYGIYVDDIPGLSAVSKLTFRNARYYNSAALSIQKKYRGWKGRKDYLAIRQKVVKIQAHVRGYQVRKKYKVIWAVRVLDKVILRWRRKGVGLRGFRPEAESTDSSEDEDILKVFRRQKVDATVDEAVSRVLSMVDSPEARRQYRRMLERYRQAKAELGEKSDAAASMSAGDTVDMDDDDDDSYLVA
ncbi:Calmodulin-binding transcription activator like [Melia azedarach]|uniref:Calmodulin-binding transcription activator like n=1 Tax=Melia azedarach TaxID=155640 RepID=A0ACC1XIS9_MELAZ|nr:Calmodulin-binding transcription activator like [Melia azedarach]